GPSGGGGRARRCSRWPATRRPPGARSARSSGTSPRVCGRPPPPATACAEPREIGGRRSSGVAGGGEPAVQVVGGADERQVGEGLGKVAEVLGLRAQLLAVQAQVVGVAEHLLEEESRLLQIPHAGEAL